jgi:hypothetical protein
MWQFADLKLKAREVLKSNYWQAFLVALIVAVVTSFGDFSDRKHDGETLSAMMTAFAGIGALIALAVRIFLGIPLEVGGNRYFIRSALGNKDFNELGFAFQRGRYAGALKGVLWMWVRIILWVLCLIVPGIIKSIAYMMVPYILADNPNIGAKRALALSEQMTLGHKWRIFVFGLSFIGWILLGILALFVGVFFLLPYIQASFAELYILLRGQAIEKGLCKKEELGLA